MIRFARLIAAAALAMAVAACAGGEGPTLPDIERPPADDGAGLEEQEQEVDPDEGPAPMPGQAPVEEPGDEQPDPD